MRRVQVPKVRDERGVAGEVEFDEEEDFVAGDDLVGLGGTEEKGSRSIARG